MGWEIKIWHETNGERVRLSIEATATVPDDVISHVTSVYWADEVQGYGDDDDAALLEPPPGTRYQG